MSSLSPLHVIQSFFIFARRSRRVVVDYSSTGYSDGRYRSLWKLESSGINRPLSFSATDSAMLTDLEKFTARTESSGSPRADIHRAGLVTDFLIARFV